MTAGYVKLWRKSLDTGWLRNHKLWVFWSYCLMKATHKPCTVIVGCQQVRLEPGQFVFGRKKTSEETGLSERKVRTCLSFLKKEENVTIKTTNKFSIRILPFRHNQKHNSSIQNGTYGFFIDRQQGA